MSTFICKHAQIVLVHEPLMPTQNHWRLLFLCTCGTRPLDFREEHLHVLYPDLTILLLLSQFFNFSQEFLTRLPPYGFLGNYNHYLVNIGGNFLVNASACLCPDGAFVCNIIHVTMKLAYPEG